MSAEHFDSFEDFWPFYVREHQNKTNRILHAIGTVGAASAIAASLLTRRGKWLLAAPLLGYGPAWIGHFFVEGNKPATFQHPLWSLRGDLRMFVKTIAGTMDEEVELAVERQGVSHARAGANGAGSNGESQRVEFVHATTNSDPSSLN